MDEISFTGLFVVAAVAFAAPLLLGLVPRLRIPAWNPSITGGGKSEDTALVTSEGVEVITRTPELSELANGRPGIAEL